MKNQPPFEPTTALTPAQVEYLRDHMVRHYCAEEGSWSAGQEKFDGEMHKVHVHSSYPAKPRHNHKFCLRNGPIHYWETSDRTVAAKLAAKQRQPKPDRNRERAAMLIMRAGRTTLDFILRYARGCLVPMPAITVDGCSIGEPGSETCEGREYDTAADNLVESTFWSLYVPGYMAGSRPVVPYGTIHSGDNSVSAQERAASSASDSLDRGRHQGSESIYSGWCAASCLRRESHLSSCARWSALRKLVIRLSDTIRRWAEAGWIEVTAAVGLVDAMNSALEGQRWKRL